MCFEGFEASFGEFRAGHAVLRFGCEPSSISADALSEVGAAATPDPGCLCRSTPEYHNSKRPSLRCAGSVLAVADFFRNAAMKKMWDVGVDISNLYFDGRGLDLDGLLDIIHRLAHQSVQFQWTADICQRAALNELERHGLIGCILASDR